MQPRKLSVAFAFFPYGGNGGISNEHPSIRNWFARTLALAGKDERIHEVNSKEYSDTPITMTRNAAVYDARKAGADVLVMCDSDQYPDYELERGEPGARPFWESSFDFLYRRYDRGPVVIGAPYCGPPPHENVYVFRWANRQSEHPGADLRLEQYPREEAAGRTGIEEVAALPTGLIMFDLRVFNHLPRPWFYYEWTDEFQREKASTEDVTCTRDIAVWGQIKLGYSPIFANWDAWAGHVKPKCVGKPQVLTTSSVGKQFLQAALCGRAADQRTVVLEGAESILSRLKRKAEA